MEDHAWLKDRIVKALPGVPHQSIFADLIELGVETEDDLQLVEAGDLIDLPPIKARKLLQNLKNKETPLAEKQQMSGEHSSSSDTAKPDQSTCSSSLSSAYRVPWHKLPKRLIEACNNDKRPEPRDRREMIRIIMDDINALCVAPSRKELRIVAQQIVAKYAKSFADTINGAVIGDGTTTLVHQLESRKENVRRQSGFARKHPKAATSTGVQPPCKKPKANLDSFGCLQNQWQPDLPEGETVETQTQKKHLLQSEYEKPTWCAQTITETMEATFSTQRFDINNSEGVELLVQEWPYLAEEKWLLDHFHRLTGIDLVERLNETIASKATRLLGYLKTKESPAAMAEVVQQIQTAVTKHQNKLPVLQGLPLLLATYFKEDVSVLIRCYDETATVESIDDNLPSTPRIVIVGTMYAPTTKIWLSVDGSIINQAVSNDKGMLMLFAAYYVFNIQYPKEASCTLDFIQRFFIGINPSSGSKFPSKKRGGNISGMVLSLANAMALFESDWTKEL